ncbi:MAG: ABC transporter permease, partial [Planctomycetota bacterium]
MNPLKTVWQGILRCILWTEHFVGLLKIAWRSIQQRALASTLTAVAMGLGVALVVAVLVIYAVIAQSFDRRAGGYELIVGKQGSKLQLVLNTAYFVGEPVGNIPYDYYLEFTEGQYMPDVEVAVPISMGHSYKSYPVVGTSPEMFDLEYRSNETYEFAKGSPFEPEGLYEAVVGSTVASQERWEIDAEFQPIHGTTARGGEAHKQQFKVVGILKPTGTPNDRAIFVNFRGFSALHSDESDHNGHDESDHQHEPAAEEPEEVTSILVCVYPSRPRGAEVLAHQINKGSVAQAALPGAVIERFLTQIIGNIQLVLLIMAVLIVVVAGIGIMVSIYNSMSDRRREIAIMRALGASRLTVMLVILMESILLSLGGGLLGLLLGHGLIALLSPVIVEQTGVAVGL